MDIGLSDRLIIVNECEGCFSGDATIQVKTQQCRDFILGYSRNK